MSKLLNRRQVIRGAASLTGAAALVAGPAEALSERDIRNWDHVVDVVVVGLGVSGGAAAYEAAKGGAKVVVLDRGSAAINESHGNDIYLGGGTPTQKAYGVEDTPEEMEKFLLATQAPEPDRERIRYYVEHSLSHYDWLKSIGIELSLDPKEDRLIYSGGEDVYPCTEMGKPAMRGHMHVSGPSGMAIQRLLTEHLRQAGVRLLLAASAQHLVRASDGRIVGIVALIDGKSQSFRAKRGVILATGGFSLNREMVALHAPLYLQATPIDVSSNDGWGIRAGQMIGAAVKRLDGAPCFYPLPRFAGILVNSDGHRFIAEESYYGILGYRIVREQGGIAHLIVDADMVGENAVESRGHGDINAKKIAATADTVAELEKMLGIPETGLQQTVTTYNEFAAKGQDPFFHKAQTYLRPLVKPPFHAVKASIGQTTFAHYTLGGLHTNVKTEVLDPENNPIPGLYAIGRTAAGILNFRFYLSGLSLGEGTLFGRVAGQTLAKPG